MATTVYSLLRHFATKHNTPQINFAEFCEYIRRYAQHHLNENPDFVPYVSNACEALTKEISRLERQHKAFIIFPDTDKKAIVIVAYFVDLYTARFKEIENNISIPFPIESDLPKIIPSDVYQKKDANEFFVELLANPLENENMLFGINFPHALPIMLMPSTVSMDTLLDLAISKIRYMLRKEEFHDYFLKKIRIANPGKELTAKNFFTSVTTKPSDTIDSIKKSTDSFYYWNQLCYFIRQDFQKVKDHTIEDLCLLQSVSITEICINYYRNKVQKDLQRETALKNLEQIMKKPPYYFNKDAIVRFTDSKGIPLLGQYTEQDLNEFLHTATTTLDKNNLPSMLIFKLENDTLYFIYKDKVLPLVSRLCNDARDVVKDILTKEWYNLCKRFETEPAMKDQKAFNEKLEQIVRSSAPVLYSLLISNFLSLVHYEARSANTVSVSHLNLFSNGKLQPYNELLMLSRQEILTDAKIMLPFWYTLPLISWIVRLFLKKPKNKKESKDSQQKSKTQSKETEKDDNIVSPAKDVSRKNEFKQNAKKVEQHLVPENSTIERELSAYEHQWNPLIDPRARMDLTEDVNSLIRDYLRRVLRTSKGSNFTPERVYSLAQTLCNTPNMQKIKEQEQLLMYVQLYMVKLVKNL